MTKYEKRKQTFELKAIEKLNKLISKISFEELNAYYQNNSQKETLEFFNITNSELHKLLKYYNIKKSKEAHIIQIKKSKFEKYGNSHYNNRDKAKETCLEKYGVDNPFKDVEHIKQAYLDKYGVEHPMKVEEICNKVISKINYSESIEKSHQTYKKITGYDNPWKNPDIINKIQSNRNKTEIKQHTIKTCLEKYGVEFPCMRLEAKLGFTNDSKPNKNFVNLLLDNNILFEREFPICDKSYDFKIKNTLVEIDPAATHNSTWNVFNKGPMSMTYHSDKSKLANDNNFRCIHIFDWDDSNKIVYLLKDKQTIYARNCTIKIVSKSDAIAFINAYHLQNYVNDKIRIGLYYDDELVSIMTFDKPRYNRNYEYELIRYCSKYNIVGGAERLFNYFIKNYNPNSIISYCDLSKFTGNVYTKLGFILLTNKIKPSCHWYNMKTKQHITDNLLRQRGFDQLFGTNYGKGTSNEELMLQNGFVRIYDCGQATFEYIDKNKTIAAE